MYHAQMSSLINHETISRNETELSTLMHFTALESLTSDVMQI